MSSYYTLNTIAELICFIVSLVCLSQDKELVWRLMTVLLGATFLSETVGRYVYLNTNSHNNHWVYNIYIWVEIAIIHFMFIHLFKRYGRFMGLVWLGFSLLLLCYIYDIVTKTFWVYSFHTFTLMSVLFILYGLAYYYLILTDNSIIDIKLSPAFWWTAGILLFSFGTTACNVFEEKLSAVMVGGHHLTYYIFRVLNIILYSLWTFSFICKKWLSKPRHIPRLF